MKFILLILSFVDQLFRPSTLYLSVSLLPIIFHTQGFFLYSTPSVDIAHKLHVFFSYESFWVMKEDCGIIFIAKGLLHKHYSLLPQGGICNAVCFPEGDFRSGAWTPWHWQGSHCVCVCMSTILNVYMHAWVAFSNIQFCLGSGPVWLALYGF